MNANASYLDFIPVFETLNEAIAIFDNEKFLWVNNAYLQLKELDSSNEIVGKPIFGGIHPDEVQEGIRVLSERTRMSKGSSGIWRIRRKDGSFQRVISHASILPNLEETVSVAIVRPVDEVQGDIGMKITKADILHEINSALTVISGYLDLMNNHEDIVKNPDLKNGVETIARNNQRIEDIIQKIS